MQSLDRLKTETVVLHSLGSETDRITKKKMKAGTVKAITSRNMSSMSTKSMSCLIKTIRQNIVLCFAGVILQYISNI